MIRRTLILAALAALTGGVGHLSAHDEFRIIGTLEKHQNSAIVVKKNTGATVSIKIDKQTEVTQEEQGATMLFSWRASGDVMHDFHGDREGQSGATAAQSYDARPRREADGSFEAPFAGIHGWFWENPGGETITIRLTTAGFYSSAHQFRFDRTRFEREVRALDTITPVAGEEAP